ncbi:MAG: nucleotidyltransferase domain-containing protein [Candidatus Micrarchaeota archaeon]
MRISRESIARQVFGSRVKRRILEFLFSNQEPVSEREMSRIFGVSHTAVNKAMQQLLDLNIVTGRIIGTALIWKLNEKSFAYPYVKAFIEASEISPLEYVKRTVQSGINTISVMNDKLRNQNLIKEAYVIGSVAEQTAKPESDIDVLVIITEAKQQDKLKQILQETIGMEILEKTGNNVSFHIYTEKNIKNNKPTWLKDAINRGIKVYSNG